MSLALEKNERGESGWVTSGTLANGSTLLTQTQIYPGKSSAVLDSITPQCALDPEFGSNGVATVTVPAQLHSVIPVPTEGLSQEGLSISVVAPRMGGGAIIGGEYERAWMVGELTAHGTLDTSFGNQGWALFPFRGGIHAILQEPSGQIILAGDNDGGGCCTRNWATALTARGELEHGFGANGREELPTGEDSGVSKLALEPNGDILVDVSGGNMGCWYTKPAMLTPSGEPVPLFAKRLARFWQGLGLHAFVGDTYLDGEGFTLIGTGPKPCYDEPPGSTAPTTGLVAHFQTNGNPDGPTIRFPSRMYGSVDAFRDGGDTLLVEIPYYRESPVTVAARRADGSLDPRFGNLGQVQIRTPATESSVEALTSEAMVKAAPGEITLLATPSERAEVQLIRLRL